MLKVFAAACAVSLFIQTNVYAQVTPPTSPKKVAWVIGNAAYPADDRLRNPVADADLIASDLKSLGFTVMFDVNLNLLQLKARLNDFANAANNSDIALVFYAGHGLAVNGLNYLITAWWAMFR